MMRTEAGHHCLQEGRAVLPKLQPAFGGFYQAGSLLEHTALPAPCRPLTPREDRSKVCQALPRLYHVVETV